MAYGNNAFNADNQIHVNTNGITLYCGDDQLALRLYDQNLSINITHVTIVDGNRRFLKENAISAMLTPDRASAFADILCNEIIPAIMDKRPLSRAIPTNKNATSILQVVTEDGECKFNIYNGIGEDRRPETTASYAFPKMIPLNDYNPQTGDFTAGNEIHAQLALVSKAIVDFVSNVSMAAAHFSRYDSRYSNRRIVDTITSMASKLGVEVKNRSFATGGSMMNTMKPIEAPAVQTVDSIDAMMGDDLPF